MDKAEFKKRTKAFAIEVAKFCRSLPPDKIVRHYIDQIVRSSASVGANYRAACRAKSKADFINKLRIVEEEADESLYFLELICEFYPDRRAEIALLYKEGNQLLAMIVSSINTALSNAKKSAIANLKSKI
ncbi:MAG: four helix bundle protein [Flavobacterium sp.]|nr:MAG: four helix bundle protein [Flavobacterium sp.]